MENESQPQLDRLQQPNFQEKLSVLIAKITENIHQEICQQYFKEPRVMQPYRTPPFEPKTVALASESMVSMPSVTKPDIKKGMDFRALVRYIENQIVYQKMIRQQNREIARAIEDFVDTLSLTEEQRSKAAFLLYQLKNECQTVTL